MRIKSLLKGAEKRSDYPYILERANYYNKHDETVNPDPATKTSIEFFVAHRGDYKSRYFFDTHDVIRYFNPQLEFSHIYGDIIDVPPYPTVVKSRPIDGDNRNSVLLNLDKLRHFLYLKDTVKFKDKQNKAVFLTYSWNKPHRVRFLEMYYHRNDICICGEVDKKNIDCYNKFQHERMPLLEHLNYKFIVAIEGNDVATNLKWIMSSNCVAIMPKPKYETWFMEGTLIPNYHYIEIAPDYSDFEEKFNYYIENPDKAEAIVKNANAYMAQFRDKRREKIIGHLVMQKYFGVGK